MNRLYALETGMTVTGAAADHRRAVRPAAIERMLEWLAGTGNAATSPDADDPWMRAVRADLLEKPSRGLVIGGDRLSPRARGLIDAINARLGSEGKTVWYSPSPLLGAGDSGTGLPALVQALRSRAVDTLVVIGGNPSYATPGTLRFSTLLRDVPNSVYVGLYENETARDTHWFVPAAHYLETWGDARAYDGTLSVVQPLVQPLHGGKSTVEILAALAGTPDAKPLDLLRNRWRALGVAPNDEAWASILRQGFVPGSALPRMQARGAQPVSAANAPAPVAHAGAIDVVFAPDARVYDGTFADNAWLQELPDPVTKLTWDNAARVSPATASRLQIDSGDPVILEAHGSSLGIPALVVPGHADDVVTLSFGYGRGGTEAVAREVGVNVYRFWSALDEFSTPATLYRATGPRHDFALTQTHWAMEGRDQARSTTRGAYRAGWQAPSPRRRELTIYDPVQRLTAPQQWAMTIDLGTCIGCAACVVACQAENNIPVVGRDDVRRSREMHWIRIDRYEEDAPDGLHIVNQPMLCQHCELAPCEYVCPVGATTHSADGLNEMVYNRCVGTRFCSNNCPYKVRRFNWFDYNAELTEVERMVKNPDVTVRERGVMEKCTFCVQRIREAEIAAGDAGRPLRGSDVKTACQQACPTNAIVFGSLTETDSDVVRRRQEPRAYAVLDDLGTLPRVQYLARVRNSNPALASAPAGEHSR